MADCSNNFNFCSWNIENLIINNHIKEDFINTKYLLDKSNIDNYDVIEKTIYDIASFHMKDKNIDFTSSNVDFSIETVSDKFNIDYNKKTKKYPLFSIITFLEDKMNPMIFTKIDLESYKYKEFTDENTFLYFKPSCFSQIVFDSSKYYGSYKFDDKANRKILKINVWDFENNEIPIYVSNDVNKQDYNSIIFRPNHNDNYSETLVYRNVIFLFLYEEFNKIPQLDHIITKNNDKSIIIIKNTDKEYYNMLFLEENFGELAKDIYVFINNNVDYLIDIENNRFYRNKIIQNILSKDVCYWIINECEKNDKWDTSVYKNYDNYLNVEKMPSIFNFLLFTSNFWLMDIKKIFNCEKINFNIKDVFISKYSKETTIDQTQNSDGSFLTFNIFLNDDVDYTDGEIFFSDSSDENVKIKQGDMLVYNGKKLRTKGSVTNGVKYVLVFMIEMILI